MFDDEATAAVDKFRADNGLVYQGNPPGLVDARFVDALRAAYFKKKKAAKDASGPLVRRCSAASVSCFSASSLRLVQFKRIVPGCGLPDTNRGPAHPRTCAPSRVRQPYSVFL